MDQIRYLCVALVVSLTPMACSDAREPATRDDCEAMVDHVIKLLADQEAGNDHPVIGRVFDLVGQGYTRISGDYKEAVRSCLAEATRGDVRCILSCETVDELADCE